MPLVVDKVNIMGAAVFESERDPAKARENGIVLDGGEGVTPGAHAFRAGTGNAIIVLPKV